VALDCSVGDSRWGSQESLLGTLVLVDDSQLLGIVKHEDFLLFSRRDVLVGGGSLLDLVLEDGKERIVVVLHDALAKAGKCGCEELVLDLNATGGIIKFLLDLGEGLPADIGNKALKVGLLVALNRVKHVSGTAVEVALDIGARVGHEVDESALLDEVVLVVDTDVLDLLLGGHEPLHLGLLSVVSPLRDELLSLVTSVHVVEVGELGADHEGEMAELRDTEVEGNDVLVVEDHTTEPLVMRPAAHAG